MNALPTAYDAIMSSETSRFLSRKCRQGTLGVLMELRQPAGDMSDPAVSDNTLIQMMTPAVPGRFDFGAGRSSDPTVHGAFDFVPARSATQILLEAEHTVRVVSINPSSVQRLMEQHCSGQPGESAFGSLSRRHFESAVLNAVLDALRAGCADDPNDQSLFAEACLLRMMEELLKLGNAGLECQSAGSRPGRFVLSQKRSRVLRRTACPFRRWPAGSACRPFIFAERSRNPSDWRRTGTRLFAGWRKRGRSARIPISMSPRSPFVSDMTQARRLRAPFAEMWAWHPATIARR